jgi:transcriptional regulator GlxA family with amidase domain
MPATRDLAVLIFEDVEVLGFCGPFEVFSVASRFTDPPAFTVLTVAESAGPVVARGGLSVNPHRCLADNRGVTRLLIESGGTQVVVPAGQAERVRGTVVDYAEGAHEGFRISRLSVPPKG